MSNLHEVRTVRCAACGRVCQETSHWFVAGVEHGRFLCRPLADRGGQRPERALKKNQGPLCGQHCAQKFFEKYLAAEATRRRSDLNNRTAGFELVARGIE